MGGNGSKKTWILQRRRHDKRCPGTCAVPVYPDRVCKSAINQVSYNKRQVVYGSLTAFQVGQVRIEGKAIFATSARVGNNIKTTLIKPPFNKTWLERRFQCHIIIRISGYDDRSITVSDNIRVANNLVGNCEAIIGQNTPLLDVKVIALIAFRKIER